MTEQLRDLLEAAVGEPPHRVRAEAVRRRAARRRMAEYTAAALAVVLLAGLGVVAASRAAGSPPASGNGGLAGAPRFYVEQGYGSGPAVGTVVRATRTGAVTATVRSPWPGASVASGLVAAARHRTFFIICQQETGKTGRSTITGSRIYRFQLTSAGRISGYSLVPGGSLDGLQVSELAATPDGSEVAVSAGPAGQASRSAPASITVINARTGARAVWHGTAAVPGKMAFGVSDLSLTADGRKLVYLAIPRCIAGRCAPTGNGEEVRAVSPAAQGGQLARSRLVARQSALVPLSSGYLDGAIVSPNGSNVDVLVMNSTGTGADTTVSVVKVSAATGRPLRTVYRVRTGNGFAFRFFSSDPFRRYLLLAAGPAGGSLPNGWIHDGHLIPLKPADGSNVAYEAW